MYEERRREMIEDYKKMFRSFTDEELEVQIQAVNELRREKETIAVAEMKLQRLLDYCERNGLYLKDNKIYGKEW